MPGGAAAHRPRPIGRRRRPFGGRARQREPAGLDLRRTEGPARKLQVGETYDLAHQDIFDITYKGAEPRLTAAEKENLKGKDGFPGFAKYAEKAADREALWNEFRKAEQDALKRTELLEAFDQALAGIPWSAQSVGRSIEARDARKKNMPALYEEYVKRVQGDLRIYIEGQKQSEEYMDGLKQDRGKKIRHALNPFSLFRPFKYIGNIISIAKESRQIGRAKARHERSEAFAGDFAKVARQTEADLTGLFREFQEKISREGVIREDVVRKLGPEFRDRFMAIINNYNSQRTVTVGWGILGPEYARRQMELNRLQGITPSTNLAQYRKESGGAGARHRKRQERSSRGAYIAASKAEARGRRRPSEEGELVPEPA